MNKQLSRTKNSGMNSARDLEPQSAPASEEERAELSEAELRTISAGGPVNNGFERPV